MDSAPRRSAVMRLGRVALAAVVSAVLGGPGCGRDQEGTPQRPPLDPVTAVERAGRSTFAEEPLQLRLAATSPQGGFVVAGPIQLRRGRFRVEVLDHGKGFLGLSSTVIGLDGEGVESTVSQLNHGLLGSSNRRCWFNTHSPAGASETTISVEEGVRLLGSIIESLRSETRSAALAPGEGTFGAPDDYDVRLGRSAAQPRDDFKETDRRVWGDRGLLANLAGPIEVALRDDGTIAEIEVEMRSHRPYGFAGIAGPGRVRRVSLRAELKPTDEALRIKQPRCLAME